MSRYRFIEAHQAAWPVRMQCRVLGVSPSGYYGWKERTPSQRELRHAAMTKFVAEAHAESRKTYGYRRVHAELTDGLGLAIGRDQVALLMRRAGLDVLEDASL